MTRDANSVGSSVSFSVTVLEDVAKSNASDAASALEVVLACISLHEQRLGIHYPNFLIGLHTRYLYVP